MADKAPQEIKDVGKKPKVTLSSSRTIGTGSSMLVSKPDGYDGTVSFDPAFDQINSLRRMAVRNGKLT